ncbi:hypothetical protein MHTCC0001_11820 [Flavobacteriaceae bacterium MHTCC 0001]
MLFHISRGYAQYKRSQEPDSIVNYASKEITFINPKADSITLAGTLTLPKNTKNAPVAILISGSGPQDRDAYLEQFNHRPFLVLADYLSSHGIAVLRFDDRGVGKSEGVFRDATSFDFASDVEAAINYLKDRKDIDNTKIGLIGHSEGGLIAPIVASTNTNVAFTVLLAAPGVNGGKILQTQSRKMLELRGTPKPILDENEKLTTIIYESIMSHKDVDSIKFEIKTGLLDFKAKNPMSVISPSITPVLIEQQFRILNSKWLLEFIRTDPKPYLAQTTCPVLALNGNKDVQVLHDINLPEVENALKVSGNTDVTVMVLDNLNHLFQTAETGNTDEYKTIEQTFAPSALKLIADWINDRF